MEITTPYYAVIFSSRLNSLQSEGYAEMAEKMLKLAVQQVGYIGVNSIREPDGAGISVSYWRDLESIQRWKEQAEHIEAQKLGRDKWYSGFSVEICKVERAYSSEAKAGE